jgi:hypothetical protein
MPNLRLPDDLRAHAIWLDETGDDERRVAFVTEERRRRVALVAGLLAIVLAVSGLAVASARLPLLAASVVLLVASISYHHGGRSGFYAITDRGDLGEYYGRRPPDLTGLRRHRIGPER